MSQQPGSGDNDEHPEVPPADGQPGTAPYGQDGRQAGAAGPTGAQPAPSEQYGRQAPGAPGQYGQYGQYGQQPPATPDQYGQYGQQPPAPADQYGQYGQYGQPGAGGYYGAGFVPVPTAVQPGIVPLRPLTLGEIYDGAFRAIRSNPMVMFGLAIIVIAAGSVLQIGLMAAFIGYIEQAERTGSLDELDAALGIGTLAGILLSSLAIGLATLVLEGLAIISVSESVIGRKIALADVWQRAKGRIWRLIGLSVLLGLATVIAIGGAVLVMVVVSIAVVEATDDPWLLIILIPVMLVALFGAIAFFVIRLMFATPAIMLEDARVFASLSRSWQLTKGHFWRLFGIMLLTTVLVSILVNILAVPFSLIGSFFAAQDQILLPLILSSIGQLVGSALSIPVMAAVLALLYVDVRMRKEGLDVELARAAQGG